MIISCLVTFLSCSDSSEKNTEEKEFNSNRPSFTPITGIDFFEVRRSFDNGLAFDTLGFEQEPIWHVNFISNDSVKIFSPDSNKMLHYSIYHDRDSFFHFGREWFRVRSLAKDSLLLQRLTVVNKHVKEARSNVYMKLYSASYLRDSLRTSIDELRKPRPNDTAFIKWRAGVANANPTVIDSAFAARKPVELVPKNPNIKVKRRTFSESERLEQSAAYEYMYPEYDIVINKAYKDFYYPFSVLVDGNGDVHLGKFVTSEEFVESRQRVLNGIIDVYLKKLLTIKPGTTLGIPHTSLIMLRVRGVE
ncbi:hypothetical protein H8S90_23680 [Olivibacter sp. SDN3]|uniref:hypothetical protein n=1 Tax=Olivibacter sp. SDN3 TaxID=2764720 RepID=UPI0016511C2E|nr:hypothetical protein [Olivibacter sp. SDN3]QNL49681.1 hypothetical protein H8S90_23680 [Olivibacter sp. SDN3]